MINLTVLIIQSLLYIFGIERKNNFFLLSFYDHLLFLRQPSTISIKLSRDLHLPIKCLLHVKLTHSNSLNIANKHLSKYNSLPTKAPDRSPGDGGL